MIKNKKILCIIPARKNSRGLKNKNIKIVNNKPLIGWSISAALNSKYIDDVIVSTDSKKIFDIANNLGASTPFIRPAHLAKDESPTCDVIMHAFSKIKNLTDNYDYFVLLEPTSPLTESSDIDSALEKMVKQESTSLVSVAKVTESHPSFCVELTQDDIMIPINKNNMKNIPRRQDVKPLYFYDGSLYISEIEEFIKQKSFFHDKTMGHVMPLWKSIEVDSMLDFYIVETIFKNMDELRNIANES
jgi:N-acylneuraminate cytidylyltransferase/CMP-N,N'-diacetyllegionaminic acid synthase